MKEVLITVGIIVAIVTACVAAISYSCAHFDKMHIEHTQQIITDIDRLQPKNDFPVEGKIESVTFDDGDVAVVSVLPESTPNFKVRRVYIFGYYHMGGRDIWNPKTFCRRTFDIRENSGEVEKK